MNQKNRFSGLIICAVIALLLMAGCQLNQPGNNDSGIIESGLMAETRGLNDEQLLTNKRIQYSGFRSSSYGMTRPYYWDETPQIFDFFTGDQWMDGLNSTNSAYPVTNNLMVWIIGRLDSRLENTGSRDGVILEMDGPAQPADIPVRFIPSAWNQDEYLQRFSDEGRKVILQIEPGKCNTAQINAIIKFLYNKYGKYKCIIGIGVDGEWNGATWNPVTEEYDTGIVEAAEAASWYTAMKTASGGTWQYLMVKHWESTSLPSIVDLAATSLTKEEISKFIFCCDSQDTGSLAGLAKDMVDFAKAYDRIQTPSNTNKGIITAPVLFQVGYHTDWWCYDPEPPANTPSGDESISSPPWFADLDDNDPAVWDQNNDVTGDLSSVGGIPNIKAERMRLYSLLLNGLEEALIKEDSTSTQTIGVIWVDFTLRRLLAMDGPNDGADRLVNSYPPGNGTWPINGDFSDNLLPWEDTIDGVNGAEGTIVHGQDANEGYAYLSVTKAGTESWQVSLSQGLLKVENGRRYKISFDAVAVDNSRPLDLWIGEDGGQYTTYGQKTFSSIPTTLANYTFEFVSSASDEKAIMEFGAGNAIGKVCLDNVTFEDITTP